MNQRLISVLAFAFVVSAGASLLLYRLLSSRTTTQAAPKSAKLVMAARALEPGTLIRDADLRDGDWTGKIPDGVLQRREDIVGRGVISPIFAGEPIVESRLALKGGGAGLAALIPKGMRAVAIRVNEIVGVAGFAGPGMRVDVLISGSPPGAAALGAVTQTLLQNVEVLSAGQNFQKDAEGKPVSVQVVNLLVTPQQAEMLSLAGNQTTIQLVLRNPLDTEIAKTNGSAVAQLFHPLAPLPEPAKLWPNSRPAAVLVRSVPPPAALPPPPKLRTVEVINGIKRTETQFGAQGDVRP
ncbi:MAG TPA: Flp pilus assembly protein CpaB [Bryobacteraceae bacterium]|jgi:pilus assembly protein CpaB|nr:Flp pilus assembly protein CpaB [Bryobacteraceae bacterium]